MPRVRAMIELLPNPDFNRIAAGEYGGATRSTWIGQAPSGLHVLRVPGAPARGGQNAQTPHQSLISGRWAHRRGTPKRATPNVLEGNAPNLMWSATVEVVCRQARAVGIKHLGRNRVGVVRYGLMSETLGK